MIVSTELNDSAGYLSRYVWISRQSLSTDEVVTASDVRSMFIYAIVCDYNEMAIGCYKAWFLYNFF